MIYIIFTYADELRRTVSNSPTGGPRIQRIFRWYPKISANHRWANVYQFIIRNLLASSLPNVFQRNQRVISSNLDTRHPLVSTIHGLNTMACQSNEGYCSVIIADILQIVTQIRHTLVPLSKRGGVPTFTVDRTLYCKVRITNSQNQSQFHSLFLLHIPSAGEPLAYSVGYFFTQSFVHWMTQKPLSITHSVGQSCTHN
jgi:hypothetical protein